MKIAIAYPPFTRGDQYPLLGQNRQFRYSSSDQVKIFPLVLATAATMLDRAHHQVLFLDGINRRLSMEEFEQQLVEFAPNLVIMETKAPIIKRHWRYTDHLKQLLPDALIALVGDHVTAFPEESMQKSQADMVIAGGDLDYTISLLAETLGTPRSYPGGVYYRTANGGIAVNGPPQEHPDLDAVPFIDRELCNFSIYGEAYLYKPCAYILTGRGCGGRDATAGCCTFCIWQHTFWGRRRRLRSPENVAAEIQDIVTRYGVREVFDDNEAGALWDYKWLEEFYQELKKRQLLGKFSLSSNARADSLTTKTVALARKIGYRLLKVGLESGNDKTLKRLKKLESVAEIKQGVKNAKDQGLIVMLTTMVGYPWENDQNAAKTYQVAKELMLYKTHFGDSLQSSILTPYPGTPLYDEALKNDWLLIAPEEYEKLDMSQPVLKTACNSPLWCQKMWKIHTTPRFLLGSLFTISSLADIKLAWGGVVSLLRHIADFKDKDEAC